jgi:hypothetical protein
LALAFALALPLPLPLLLLLLLLLLFWLSFRSAAEESASVVVLAFAVVLAFLSVIPEGNLLLFSVALALAFLVVIPSAARNLLLARAASARSCPC